MVLYRHMMHRRRAKHLRLHEREFSDLLEKAKTDDNFIHALGHNLGKMSDTQIAESYVLHLADVKPAEAAEIILDPV